MWIIYYILAYVCGILTLVFPWWNIHICCHQITLLYFKSFINSLQLLPHTIISYLNVLVSLAAFLTCLCCPFSLLSAQPEAIADSQLHFWRHQPNEQLWWPLSHSHPYRSKRCVGVFSLMQLIALQIISQLIFCFIKYGYLLCCRCGGPLVLAGRLACSGRYGEDPHLYWPLLSASY